MLDTVNSKFANESAAGPLRRAFRDTLRAYGIPSLAFWRAAELAPLRGYEYARPVLEVGCGNGAFAGLLFEHIELGIDSEPKQIRRCRNRTGSIYQSVSVMDARKLELSRESFRTIFANCVLEHIPNIEKALVEFSRVLQPGGSLVATIPLAAMEECMRSSSAAYLARRRRDLVHLNLFTRERWTEMLTNAGFHRVEMTPYLREGACRKWDDVEFGFGLGVGRITVSQLYRRARAVLPRPVRNALDRFWYRRLLDPLVAPDRGKVCAVILKATKIA